ncbi:MAG TPA: YggS family pyridoxal phosphate-dependent enzyme [Anaerohalosphaeraceae bacterium]|nr:YggS family pyridoxal phosphate-dependent enzyme [Anaerohalosphaeraceae bacterium]HRT50705.1 YggS family pyridoxal phosphate-dependent enzyme [Anaerohalosphaeraceae bacterium]HRT86943.1 YggS family pyridoxal phosphate-dependent enzyme [Anaerohalosphaeraceae bacterium]
MMGCTSKISDRLKTVRNNVRKACDRVGRDPKDVKIIIVTKTAAIEAAKEVIRLGFTELGENRVQHLKQVAAEMDAFLAENKDDPNIPKKITWHMIGHLQRNKVKPALQISSIIHSVDTLRLAEEIDQVAAKLGTRPDVLLQVNCSDEPQKYGVPVGAATHLAEQFTTMKNIRLIGLMTMAPLTLNKDIVRRSFVRAREIFEEIKGERLVGPEFCHLSMGMSQDYEIAVEEGATMLRIGSAIFA